LELVQRIVEYEGDQTFTPYFIGDTHIGTIHHDRKLWLRDIQRIADDPRALWVGMGDAVEAITLTDPRFSAKEIDEPFRDRLDDLPYAQLEQFIEDVAPIADKCLGLHEGNHETEYQRRHYGKLTLKACEGLGMPFLSDTAMTRLVFRYVSKGERQATYVLTIYSEHGTGGGRKKGAKVNALEDLSAGFAADVYARGHVHTKLIWEGARLSIPAKGALVLRNDTPLFILTGSYYRSYEVGSTSYGQRASYPPTVLGCERIFVQPLARRAYKP